MSLSATDYQALPLAEKRLLIQRKGQRVASRYQERYSINLYQLEGLLVEVWYDIDEQRLHRIDPCLDAERLDAYAEKAFLRILFNLQAILA